ncbi:MAG: NUDIX hydrolase [Patescibacteria group bacterium]|jgi:8-oxo-dGTP pyrophosphatase MutT (NUDIX family)
MENRLTQVAFVYLTQDDKVLLLQESGQLARGLWSMPGGHLESEETFAEGAIREALEESGYQVDLGEIVYQNIISRMEYKGNRRDTDQVEIKVFKGKIIGGQMQIDNEALDLKWFDKASALALPHRFKFLKELIENN